PMKKKPSSSKSVKTPQKGASAPKSQKGPKRLGKSVKKPGLVLLDPETAQLASLAGEIEARSRKLIRSAHKVHGAVEKVHGGADALHKQVQGGGEGDGPERELPDDDDAVTVTEKPATDGKPFPIVGIGASAGGFEAFTEFLRHLPRNTGMAFVLVQHLDPKHR